MEPELPADSDRPLYPSVTAAVPEINPHVFRRIARKPEIDESAYKSEKMHIVRPEAQGL
jgi:hypothetical protein